MSISLCTDQLLLDLLPPSRIISVTYLSREPDESYLSGEAWKVGVNYGTAEEVVKEQPDLVLAGTYTTPATRLLVKEVGIPVMELPPANTFQEIREQTLEVGRVLGAEARAERLVHQMDATVVGLARTAPKRRITIVGLDGAGSAYGRDTLFNALVSAAGAVNLGASTGLRAQSFDTERLLWVQPDLLAIGDATIAAPSLETSYLIQSLLRHRFAGREIIFPELLYSCGLPQSVDAAVQLRRVMLRALRHRPAP